MQCLGKFENISSGHTANSPHKTLKFDSEFIELDPAFQRFAVRTSRRIEDISSKAAQKREELAEQMKDFSKNFEQQSKKQ